jgi:glycosyltransferase involved in cell wall biosynthesis
MLLPSTQSKRPDSLYILVINDIGFQYGAGIATLRQIQSLLIAGYTVELLCLRQGPEAMIPVNTPDMPGTWLGYTCLDYLDVLEKKLILDTLVLEVALRKPDIVLVGNLHSANIPLELLPALQSLGCKVVAYLHDCYLMTGRCAYAGNCQKYKTGCDSQCPTAEEYPSLVPEQIAGQWQLRQKIFCGPNGVPLLANSEWTAAFARRALGGPRAVECLYYGLDTNLFSPIDRQYARKLLGLPENAFIVLGGAVNLNLPRKGGQIFIEIYQQLKNEVEFLAFGWHDVVKKVQSLHKIGLVRDYRKMPLIYSAADLFVGTSLEEAFGQTFCEAQACGLPVVAFAVGGIPEIARHGTGARLADTLTAQALIAEIRFFRANPDARADYSRAGRAMVEAEFSLQSQATRWRAYCER